MEANTLLRKIVEALVSEGVLLGAELKPHMEMPHGSCCCCTVCGHYHEDCVCSHNRIITALTAIFSEFKKSEMIEEQEPTYESLEHSF